MRGRMLGSASAPRQYHPLRRSLTLGKMSAAITCSLEEGRHLALADQHCAVAT